MKKILCSFSIFVIMLISTLPLCGNAQMYTEWATGVGGTGFDRTVAVDTDDGGNVYTSGYFMNRVDFNPSLTPADTFFITATSFVDLFLMKQDPAGNFLWARNMGGFASSFDASKNMVSDAAGYTYVVGGFEGTADFGAGNSSFNLSSNGDADMFIFKMDPAGNLVWSKSIGGTGREYALSLALDRQGHLLITGLFNLRVDFNPGTAPADTFFLTAPGTNNRSSIFVLKLDTAGHFKWVRGMGSTGNSINRGQSIATDLQGNVYVTGLFQGTVDMDPSPLPTDTFRLISLGGGSLLPGTDIFVLKLDSAGKFVWAKSLLSMDNNNRSWFVSVDHSGNTYITGSFFAKLDLDPRPAAGDTFYVTSAGGRDIFILKLDTAGDFAWGKNIRSRGGDDEGRSVFTDIIDNVYLTGNFSDTAHLINPGRDTIFINSPASNDQDIFLAKLDAEGNFLWARNPQGTGHDYGVDVVTDRSGNVIVGGAIKQAVLFEQGLPPVISNGGDFDAFTWKLGCTDTSTAQVTLTGTCPEYVYNDIVYTSSGTYIQKLPNAKGCDSIITIFLTMKAVKPEISVNEYELQTTAPYATYQWLLNDTVINGANERVYKVVANGNYRVVITDEYGCTDTSDVYEVSNVSITGITGSIQISIYPNPTTGTLYIDAPTLTDAAIYSIEGRLLLRKENAKEISAASLAPGMYILYLHDKNGILLKAEKISKE